MEPGTVAQWFAASATSAAVLVALFKDEVLKWKRKPILTLSVALEPPHCHSTFLQYEIQRTTHTFVTAQCYYFRLWVKNEGRSRAENVQVFASRLFRRIADGTFQADANFLPLNLRWAHTKNSDGTPEIYAEGISPKMGKHCDLGHITDPKCRAELGEDLPNLIPTDSVLALDLEVVPNTRSHILAPGSYRLELHVAASNCSPVVTMVEITVTGKWFEQENKMFRDGIGLRVSI